jgi:hypothetical protein
MPLLFVTIACGAISGFHGLVGSGTTSKQLNKEPDARFVGYLGSFGEGSLALVAIIAATAGFASLADWQAMYTSFGQGGVSGRSSGRRHHPEQQAWGCTDGVRPDAPDGDGDPLRRHDHGCRGPAAALHRPGVGRHLPDRAAAERLRRRPSWRWGLSWCWRSARAAPAGRAAC